MKKTIDSNLIRISGKFEIPRKISIGEDIELVIKANCVKIEMGDNQDGTVNMTYIVKPLEINIKE